MYDVIVVGARNSGAATAMLLARRGAQVLLVDRATFPSEIPRGHFIHRHGPERLARWGVLDAVLATGCPPIRSMTMDLGDYPMTGLDLGRDGVPYGLGPRRARIDQVLIDAAVAAGAEVRTGFAVDELLFEDDRVVGIRGRTGRGGPPVTAHADVVVGADGRNSMVAKAAGAEATTSTPTLSCWYFGYWSGVRGTGLEMHAHDRRAIFAFPTHDDLLAVFVGFPIAELPEVRRDIEGAMLGALDGAGDLGERVRGGRREERLLGATQLPNFLRRPHGPGWALVGDAGCHKDPFMALGMCDGLRDAELAATAIGDGLAGEAPMEAAMAGYEQRRDEATLPDYRTNLFLARLGPAPPELLELRASIRGDQAAIDAFYNGRFSSPPPPPVPGTRVAG